ncbi:MAG: DUF1573 domain-containing protein [Bacteroidota bacterium]
MKRKICLLSLLLIGIFALNTFQNGVFANDLQDEGPRFEFKAEDNRLELDTMYIDEVKTVNLEIEFENKGSEPLILSKVSGCCGTRIDNYPKEPVKPGEMGVIEISFRLIPRPHNINRTVTVLSNDSEGRDILRIRGKVAEKN